MNEARERLREALHASLQPGVGVVTLPVTADEVELLEDCLDEAVLTPDELRMLNQYVNGGVDVPDGTWYSVGTHDVFFWTDPTGVRRATLYRLGEREKRATPRLQIAWPMTTRLTKQA
jgi:hypothetical protein